MSRLRLSKWRRSARSRGINSAPRSYWAVFAALVVTAVLGAGYLADSDVIATATSPSGAPNGPGSVVETQPLSRLAPELQAAAAQSVRVVYRSTDV